jgi:hypothetical protein
MAKLALLFLIATATLIKDVYPRETNVLTVTGTLRCGAQPTNAKHTSVVLISKHTFSKDEKREGIVDEAGKFEINMVSTTKSLKPEVIVYTSCAKGSSICKRRLRFAVPDSAVNNQVYSIGEVDLERQQVGEGRECSSGNAVTVTGTLFCDGKPATPKDTYLALLNIRDILADEKEVSAVKEGGKFQVTLITDSKSVHPEVHVYTECNKGNNKCKRKLKFAVPTDYVNSGETYDIGEIKMEVPTATEGRERECA